ncbi:hypothetical protein OGAPHI_003461 [Ogataea philodendri]|uniref:Uncharacterized protein n=1 Tax=Ogataea philodendri TaxID=1378263 RepID=A0A9P8P757_9ASCO|nr:uncharacterized protein OGAPHI_003461 [Ogataea philodendri]KAH3666465.1 hypothetical protein OGAPHI_003461 [Ogataea philodendri]
MTFVVDDNVEVSASEERLISTAAYPFIFFTVVSTILSPTGFFLTTFFFCVVGVDSFSAKSIVSIASKDLNGRLSIKICATDGRTPAISTMSLFSPVLRKLSTFSSNSRSTTSSASDSSMLSSSTSSGSSSSNTTGSSSSLSEIVTTDGF